MSPAMHPAVTCFTGEQRARSGPVSHAAGDTCAVSLASVPVTDTTRNPVIAAQMVAVK